MPQDVIAAARANDVEQLRTLLARGAEADARDEQGWTALCWAAGAGATQAVRALLDHGADPRASGADGRTPYRIALAAARVETARLLAESERVRDGSGSSAVAADTESRGRSSYCRAYLLRDLQPFGGWTDEAEAALTRGGPARDPEEAVVFVHMDFSVTRTSWFGEEPLYDGAAPAWRRFCVEQLAFRPPDAGDSQREHER